MESVDSQDLNKKIQNRQTKVENEEKDFDINRQTS